HRMAGENDASGLSAALTLMGINLNALEASDEDPALLHWSTHLLSLREDAMKTKDFAEVDRIKSALVSSGVNVQISKDGVFLSPTPDYDAAKLEALK
ncbi:MAG: cysteine--tRNA ligase, partial [Pseudomonadota bacterium]